MTDLRLIRYYDWLRLNSWGRHMHRTGCETAGCNLDIGLSTCLTNVQGWPLLLWCILLYLSLCTRDRVATRDLPDWIFRAGEGWFVHVAICIGVARPTYISPTSLSAWTVLGYNTWRSRDECPVFWSRYPLFTSTIAALWCHMVGRYTVPSKVLQIKIPQTALHRLADCFYHGYPLHHLLSTIGHKSRSRRCEGSGNKADITLG